MGSSLYGPNVQRWPGRSGIWIRAIALTMK